MRIKNIIVRVSVQSERSKDLLKSGIPEISVLRENISIRESTRTITMEIQDDDEISTEKVGTSGHIYLLGVCGIWLPWRPETYIIRQAARKRSENTFGGVA